MSRRQRVFPLAARELVLMRERTWISPHLIEVLGAQGVRTSDLVVAAAGFRDACDNVLTQLGERRSTSDG